jgi:hypothetical protein
LPEHYLVVHGKNQESSFCKQLPDVQISFCKVNYSDNMFQIFFSYFF